MTKLIPTFFLLLFFTTTIFCQNFIYIGDSGLNNVKKFDLEGNFIEVIDEDINTPRGIEIDYNNRYLFYVNASQDELSIRSFHLDTKEIKVLIKTQSALSRLALNKATKEIYFSESMFNRICKIKYDGTQKETIHENLLGVNQLEFDPLSKLIYYVDIDGDMYKMDTIGNNIEIVSTDLDNVHSFKLDYVNENIYMTERGSTNAISFMKYNGSEKTILFATNQIPLGIDIDYSLNKIFYATADHKIHAANLDGSNSTELEISSKNIGLFTLEQDFLITSTLFIKDTAHKLLLYPNPVISNLKLKHQGKIIDEIAIFDSSGKYTYSKTNIKLSEFEIDLSNLIAGSYVLYVKYTDGNIESQKLIK